MVSGIGAPDNAVPPTESVYHFNDVPVAVRAVAVFPSQYTTGELTVGAAGRAFTTTAMVALTLSQL